MLWSAAKDRSPRNAWRRGARLGTMAPGWAGRPRRMRRNARQGRRRDVRHCEERSDAAIQAGLLRFARNDGEAGCPVIGRSGKSSSVARAALRIAMLAAFMLLTR